VEQAVNIPVIHKTSHKDGNFSLTEFVIDHYLGAQHESPSIEEASFITVDLNYAW